MRLFFSFLVISIFSFSNSVSAQMFTHVENVAGLNILMENNGASVADYDGDLDLDIFVVAKSIDEEGVEISHSRLLQNNNNGTFTDVTEESGLLGILTSDEDVEETLGLDGLKYGASWGDYNNDGFPDILLTYSLKVQLFKNMGDGTFTEVTETSGIQGFNNCINTGATWFDYDNDGFLDLHISDWGFCTNTTLYHNNGDETFTNVSNIMQVEGREIAYTAIPYDFNNDGWMDLYLSNDQNKPNVLYINDQGNGLVDQASNYGLDHQGDDMAITMGDFNNDGYFDFFITNINENVLYVNNGINSYIDIAIPNNLNETGWSWDTKFSDFDLDGDEDLFIVNGYEFSSFTSDYNVFFENIVSDGGEQNFQEVSEEVGLRDLTLSVSAVDFDFDNDGDVDILVTNAGGPSYLYENTMLNFYEEGNLHWLKVSLQGTISNRSAIGTELTLTTNGGTIKRYYHGVGFLGQSQQPVHFGLNQETQILELEIKWPSGLVETYQNIDADSYLSVIEGNGFEILEVPPSIKNYGCTDPNSCSYNPLAYIDDGSCTYLESQEILGSVSSGFFKIETYSYPLANGSFANWDVVGGTILEGQGTSEILVEWGMYESGIVRVTETGQECQSLPSELNVDLNIALVDDNKSIARIWNEALLESIRNDYARPTVHARNLFHTSVAMYDAWAIYDNKARPYLIGNTVHEFTSELEEFVSNEDLETSRKIAISYAAYRLLNHRFVNSPDFEDSQRIYNLIMDQLGYDTAYTSTDYASGNPAALGNYIAQTLINYGLQDGSREQMGYDNAFYEPVNEPLVPVVPGNETITNPNRWQPLSLDIFIDQSGNIFEGSIPDFLGPEWGSVLPFALEEENRSVLERDGNTFIVYNDLSEPPLLDATNSSVSSEAYKWGFSLVSVWSSHLDPTDGVMWDISPRSIGNIPFESLPTNYEQYPDFYDLIDGGAISSGRNINPITGNPYEIQMVPRGDYTRVLAEFWADGPDSETPPGHWFTILNYVNDHPLLVKKIHGEGEVLQDLEWDVKSYFILGGTMHDAAVSAWGIKGYYDYIRPISAIRYMAAKGQSTEESLPNFHPEGINLIEGYIEQVTENDPLAINNPENVGKIKLKAWRGHEYIEDTTIDDAGVGWILAENWWPYQRPSFVTPPFAGFVSGHSTFSRAAAEVLTLLTGNEYFPGGIGEFKAKRNEFLVFEQGPSVDVRLQWATYRDASDQTSLSRIWGGIHPPADDIPGRLIGEQVGREAFGFALPYFNGRLNINPDNNLLVFPNPVLNHEIYIANASEQDTVEIFDITGRRIHLLDKQFIAINSQIHIKLPEYLSSGLYVVRSKGLSKIIVVSNN